MDHSRLASLHQIEGITYQIVGQIGEGGAAGVYLAKRESGETFALKIIKNYKDENIKQMVDLEIRIQKEFKGSKNVIQYIGFKEAKNEAYIVLELGECSLRTWIDSKNSILQDKFIKLVCFVCEGIMEIHEKKFIHRDIKPENIIKIDGHFKITDFGVSSDREEDDSITGTPLYWAPEIFEEECETFTNKVDVWSLGVTMFEVYFKVNPFGPLIKMSNHRKSIDELKKNIQILTPNFSMEKFLKFLRSKGMEKECLYIEKKLSNTNKVLVDVLCTLFDPNPTTRPDITLIYTLFLSMRSEIQQTKVLKTRLNKHLVKSLDEVPEDIRIFCYAKDLFYELNAIYKVKSYDEIVFAFEIGIWYIEGKNYFGHHYVLMDKIEEIKKYKKDAKELKQEVRQLLSAFYVYLKSEEDVGEFESITELRIYVLVCSVWWDICSDDRSFCEKFTEITGFMIDCPQGVFSYLEILSERNIGDLENFIVGKYYV